MTTPSRVAALLTVCLLVAAGCSDDDPAADTTTTTTTASTTAPTTASTEPTTTAPPAPTVFTNLAQDAVNELKAAWEGRDRPRALAVAPVGVVDELFALDPGGYEIYGCDTGEFATSTCNYRSRSQGIQIAVTARHHEPGWQIESIHVSQD